MTAWSSICSVAVSTTTYFLSREFWCLKNWLVAPVSLVPPWFLSEDCTQCPDSLPISKVHLRSTATELVGIWFAHSNNHRISSESLSFVTSGGEGGNVFLWGWFSTWRGRAISSLGDVQESPGQGAEQPQVGLDSAQLQGGVVGLKTSRGPFPPLSICEAKESLICFRWQCSLVIFFTQLLSFIRLLLDFKIRRWRWQNKPLKKVSSFYCCGYLQGLDCSWTNEDLYFSSHLPAGTASTACQHASQLTCLKIHYRVNLQYENKQKYCRCSSARASLPCFTSSASLWLLKWLRRWEEGKSI